MIDISVSQQLAVFVFRKNEKSNLSKGLSIHPKHKINDIVITVKWEAMDMGSTFGLRADYLSGNKLIKRINYNDPNYKSNSIELTVHPNSIEPNELIDFIHFEFTGIMNKDEITLKIYAQTYEEGDRQKYIARFEDNKNGFSEYTDIMN